MALLVTGAPPCALFEDDHLLVVNKPAGLNTHAPSPFAGEGLYEWLRHREPRWGRLAIIHRLDKETSGVLVFSKTSAANTSLTRQFTDRRVRKRYVCLVDRCPPEPSLTLRSRLVRVGPRYASQPHGSGTQAETRFKVLAQPASNRWLVEAEPITGRTHQIRVHAAEAGFPILGDALYGGRPELRVCLHALELTLRHPEHGGEMAFSAEADFQSDPRVVLREALWNFEETNCLRLIQGSADQWPGWFVDRLGDYLLSSSARAGELGDKERAELQTWSSRYKALGTYHKQLHRSPGMVSATAASPRLLEGQPAPDRFWVRENGLEFGLSFGEGYSTGLFLDQRENRRRLLASHVAADFPLFPDEAKRRVLNTFAYTCGFSVCAAKAGGQTTSLDLSKHYLEWGRQNFVRNQINPDDHDFIYGDCLGWLPRLARKQRCFDLILLDPPTFSRSKEHGSFQVDKDLPRLIALALPLLAKHGVLFASSNAALLPPESFLAMLQESIGRARRSILQRQYVPQPPDFRISREEPGYLKTAWCRIA